MILPSDANTGERACRDVRQLKHYDPDCRQKPRVPTARRESAAMKNILSVYPISDFENRNYSETS